ncbi:cell envelope integrity protein TolA [Polynucleobacter sp. es-GGE-1]|uniref:cell envelope integrity protein TolA n=1 Tax=Polynucleobacter sp. es-GGE-1 TaxID=1819724 RepID=UPI001C0C5830|nr:cell envelope integrity protein TolA [Polynucleobacter sp. es-GGE-1]MBU3635497.1 cell envelope integrity protein TolA [Polynucleobacter sp. es-GGE-1]
MNSASTFQSPHSSFKRGRFTKEESTKRAFTFSLIAHLGLLAFLVIGISWNNSTPSGVEVELWDSAPQVATKSEPELKTVMKEEAADIAVKKKEVEKEAAKKEAAKETTKVVKPSPPKKEEPPKKTEAPKALSPTETKANAAAEKVRADQLARLRAAAGAEGGSGGKVGSGVGGGGNAPPGWKDRINKKVRPLIVFNQEFISGNPAAVIKVNLAPDGAIMSTSVLTSSGNNDWDRAVLLALSRAESLPKDDNGKIPQREISLTFKLKD